MLAESKLNYLSNNDKNVTNVINTTDLYKK